MQKYCFALEYLESRNVTAVNVIATTSLIRVIEDPAPGDTVALSNIALHQAGYAPLRSMAVSAVPGTTLNDVALSLHADLYDRYGRLRPDGVYETNLGAGAERGNVATFNLGIAGVLARYRPLQLQIRGTVDEDATEERIGVGRVHSIEPFGHRRGYNAIRILHRGPPNPVYHIDYPQEEGGLIITKDSIPVPQGDLLGGSLTEPVLRLNLKNIGTSQIDVTRLAFSVEGLQAVDRLELSTLNATTPFASATVAGVAGGYGDMAAVMTSGQLIINPGEEVTILVRPRMKSDVDGGESGTLVRVNLTDDPRSVEARDLSTFNQLWANDGDGLFENEVVIGTATAAPNRAIAGTAFRSVLSQIVNVTNANPDANETAVPNGFSRQIGQFKFTADTNVNSRNGLNKAILDGLTFDIEATNIQLGTTVWLANKADLTQRVAVTLFHFGGERYGVRMSGISSQLNAELGSGENQTFVLIADIVNPAVNPSQQSVLQVALRLDDLGWIDRDVAGSQAFTGLRLPFDTVRSTRYVS